MNYLSRPNYELVSHFLLLLDWFDFPEDLKTFGLEDFLAFILNIYSLGGY